MNVRSSFSNIDYKLGVFNMKQYELSHFDLVFNNANTLYDVGSLRSE